MISINKHVMKMVTELIENAEALGCSYFRLANGAHVIDMGIEVSSGWKAAKMFSEIYMACLGTCDFRDFPLDDKISLSAVEVFIDNTELACLASQMAGLQLSEGEFSVIASGPARAMARAEGDLHIQQTSYQDNHNQAVLGITAKTLPDEAFAEKAAQVCGVKTDELYLLMHSYDCIVCTVQVSARIVEQTINQMMLNNFDLSQLVSARGYCAIAPLAGDDLKAMGWVNDCLLYGGKAALWVKSTDEEIKTVIPKIVTESAADYGRLFIEMFEEAGRDFYAMDLSIHSPAMVQIININSGNIFIAGDIRKDILKKSIFNI